MKMSHDLHAMSEADIIRHMVDIDKVIESNQKNRQLYMEELTKRYRNSVTDYQVKH
ncbi:unnamed protein product, partial [Oppiella nova]